MSIRNACSSLVFAMLTLTLVGCSAMNAPEDGMLHLNMRSRVHKSDDAQAPYAAVEKETTWDPARTAIVVIDMWDDHWCKSAARRVNELAVHMNDMLKDCRERGILVVHSPATVTSFYDGMRPRLLAQNAPYASPPIQLASLKRWGTTWVYPDPSREADLPIDDTDMGCDDAAKCVISSPWRRENPLIEIDVKDAITDNGQELWNLLESRGIKNVIYCGVHLNMCVLGRGTGIREMVKLGKNVVLMRDMTDTMYNPARPPYVSHFQGTDLVVEHVEKYWCPSITSEDIAGKKPYRFADDNRPVPGPSLLKRIGAAMME